MEMINDILGYKNLKIYQNDLYFSFSLDSIVLANYSTIRLRDKKIVDFCTGNAVIPIILSTKTSAKITAVEIQKDVFDLAKDSLNINNLNNNIDLINMDIKDFSKNQESDIYDVITCNPPYFKISDTSYMNEDVHKQIARHEIMLTLEDLMMVGKKLLKNGGSIYLVHRPERLLEITEAMRKNNIEPKRIKFVYPSKEKDSNIILIEGIKNGSIGLKIENPLYVYDDEKNYTKEIMNYFN